MMMTTMWVMGSLVTASKCIKSRNVLMISRKKTTLTRLRRGFLNVVTSVLRTLRVRLNPAAISSAQSCETSLPKKTH